MLIDGTEWKFVPVEPTQEMLDVLTKAAAQTESWRHGYYNMLAAAPVAAQAPAADEDARDAARYRYLIASSPREEVCFLGVAYFGKEALDRAIDAAMAEQEAGGYTL